MYTLAILREMARERADQQTSQFVTDVELTRYINNSYSELYDILVARFEDYYEKDPVAFSITNPSVNYISIPTDLYKIRGLDYSMSGTGPTAEWATVYPYNFTNRNKFNATSRSILGRLGVNYKLMGSKLYLLPADKSLGNYQLWYIPQYTPLVSDNDIMSDVLDFDEYVIVDAAIKCKIKEESDTTDLRVSKRDLKERIEEMASNRDAGMPQQIADINSNQMYAGAYPYWGGL